jgi:hypothetical protein
MTALALLSATDISFVLKPPGKTMPRYQLYLPVNLSLFRFAGRTMQRYLRVNLCLLVCFPSLCIVIPTCTTHSHHRHQLVTIDVFVDDFIGAAQDPTPAHLNRGVRRILLLTIAVDQIFRPVDPHQVTSAFAMRTHLSKRCSKGGDANWSTCKTILGSWIINTIAMTISLPPHRLQCLADILAEILLLPQKRQDVLGEMVASNSW